jgi:hypothetical protein
MDAMAGRGEEKFEMIARKKERIATKEDVDRER